MSANHKRGAHPDQGMGAQAGALLAYLALEPHGGPT